MIDKPRTMRPERFYTKTKFSTITVLWLICGPSGLLLAGKMQSGPSSAHDQSNADASSMLAQLPSSNDAGSSEWSSVTLEPRSVSESDSLEHVVGDDHHLHQVMKSNISSTTENLVISKPLRRRAHVYIYINNSMLRSSLLNNPIVHRQPQSL